MAVRMQNSDSVVAHLRAIFLINTETLWPRMNCKLSVWLGEIFTLSLMLFSLMIEVPFPILAI